MNIASKAFMVVVVAPTSGRCLDDSAGSSDLHDFPLNLQADPIDSPSPPPPPAEIVPVGADWSKRTGGSRGYYPSGHDARM